MDSERQQIRIKDEIHSISRDDVVAAANGEVPRRLNSYYVEIGGKRFPPKQLLRAATKTTRTFDSAIAVRALQNLGFEVVRLEGSG
jgi:5-methylcytosine-specific restriction enzyme B